jgi:HTH-type transcriptional regulator/antitoxin MqsA
MSSAVTAKGVLVIGFSAKDFSNAALASRAIAASNTAKFIRTDLHSLISYMPDDKILICATCGAKALVFDTRDLPHTYLGETNIIKQVTAYFCSTCGEGELDGKPGGEAHRVSIEMGAFIAKVRKQKGLPKL